MLSAAGGGTLSVSCDQSLALVHRTRWATVAIQAIALLSSQHLSPAIGHRRRPAWLRASSRRHVCVSGPAGVSTQERHTGLQVGPCKSLSLKEV